MKTCAVENCSLPHKGHGLCNGHLKRFRQQGDDFDRSPVLSKIRARSPICTISGCGKHHFSLGLCSSHYSRLQREGPEFDRSIILSRAGVGDDVIQHALTKADPDACIEWPLHRSAKGYGRTTRDGVQIDAHRLVCILAHGTPPSDKHFACHSCDNPSCINKHHLRWDTHQGNIADRQQRNRQMHGSRHYKAKLTEDDVRDIRSRLLKGESEQALAIEYGVTHGSIWFIRNGVTWKHVA